MVRVGYGEGRVWWRQGTWGLTWTGYEGGDTAGDYLSHTCLYQIHRMGNEKSRPFVLQMTSYGTGRDGIINRNRQKRFLETSPWDILMAGFLLIWQEQTYFSCMTCMWLDYNGLSPGMPTLQLTNSYNKIIPTIHSSIVLMVVIQYPCDILDENYTVNVT